MTQVLRGVHQVGIAILGLMLAAAPLGCGGSGVVSSAGSGAMYPVSGKVLLPDGKPLSGGTITFVPDNPANKKATGAIQADGGFTLTTTTDGDGAGPGDYQAMIDPGAASGAKIAPRYLDSENSGLKATIEPKPNELPPFKLLAR